MVFRRDLLELILQLKKIETDQKLVNSEFCYGVPFQAQPLLDCLDQMSAKVDQGHHSLSRSGVADLMASVDVDVERTVVETDEVVAEIVAVFYEKVPVSE